MFRDTDENLQILRLSQILQSSDYCRLFTDYCSLLTYLKGFPARTAESP